MTCLTSAEREILDLTAELWNKFSALPDQHPSDGAEIALAPTAQHPELFR